MKAVILAGGLGTRISQNYFNTPKPLIEIGEKPIIWHLIKYFSFYKIKDIIICTGYKSNDIKNFFLNQIYYNNDISIDLNDNSVKLETEDSIDCRITIINTGLYTNTGGRLLKIKRYLKNEYSFILSYCDGLTDLNLNKLINFQEKSKFIATLTAVNSGGRFGTMKIENKKVKKFNEKLSNDGRLINGGFYVIKNEIFNYIKNDETSFEYDCLEYLSRKGKLGAYHHDGFWQCMDTIRDKDYLEKEWLSKKCKWKIWK